VRSFRDRYFCRECRVSIDGAHWQLFLKKQTVVNRTHHQELLEQALAGDAESLGSLLENYRAYLSVLAQRYLDPRLQGRLDPADIVQVTFLEAQRDLNSFRGHQIEELLGWLRNILRNNVLSAHQKHLFTQKRSAGREISNSPTDSRPALTDLAPSETTSPSQRLMRDEAAVYLANCLEGLPDTQREALRLRYVEGFSLKQLAERMNKSEMAVAGLLKRGLQTLRERMITDSSGGGFVSRP
jgi:RNA polymerase sigma-70 factor, ECF subfamily